MTVLPALMYHSVSAVAGPMRDLAVPPRLLAEQLGALSAAGYRLVGLSEALDLLDAGTDDRLVAVTFDDGYRDFLTAGLPVLRDAGAGATLYAAVGHLGSHAAWLGRSAPAFGPMLSWAELAEVAAAGVEIGNHSLIHHPLDVLPATQVRREVARGRAELEQRLQLPVRSFAYPHGYHSRRVRGVVAATGHDNATEVGRRRYVPGDRATSGAGSSGRRGAPAQTSDDRFAVPRLQPTPRHRGADLLALVAGGGPRLVPRLKRIAGPGWRLARRGARLLGGNLT